MEKIVDRIVNADRIEDIISVFGSFDENIKRIEDAFHVTIVNRDTELKITGDAEATDKAQRLSLMLKAYTISELLEEIKA